MTDIVSSLRCCWPLDNVLLSHSIESCDLTIIFLNCWSGYSWLVSLLRTEIACFFLQVDRSCDLSNTSASSSFCLLWITEVGCGSWSIFTNPTIIALILRVNPQFLALWEVNFQWKPWSFFKKQLWNLAQLSWLFLPIYVIIRKINMKNQQTTGKQSNDCVEFSAKRANS